MLPCLGKENLWKWEGDAQQYVCDIQSHKITGAQKVNVCVCVYVFKCGFKELHHQQGSYKNVKNLVKECLMNLLCHSGVVFFV